MYIDDLKEMIKLQQYKISFSIVKASVEGGISGCRISESNSRCGLSEYGKGMLTAFEMILEQIEIQERSFL